MLQRIQSIWLLLASAAAFLSFKFSFFSGNRVINGQSKFDSITGQSNIFILALTFLLGAGALITIFLYKKRKTQFRICITAIAASLLMLYLYFYETQQFTEGKYDLTSIITLAIPVFWILASRGIRRDEKLVKSLNRLR